MKSIQNGNVRFVESAGDLGESEGHGISLHCHTQHSHELLDFVPYYAVRIPIVSTLWRREMKRLKDRGNGSPDFSAGYWSPPLSPMSVYNEERKSLRQYGLDAIVSITDHDSIKGNIEINDRVANDRAPVSMEWTVPFENAFFHVGVHNLPIEQSAEITRQMLEYTYSQETPNDARLKELFSMLNALPDVLVVLNHPIWDIEMIGQRAHELALQRFLAKYLTSIHALEINGFRSWSENAEVIALAETLGLPVISGGDRHCCQANTMVNITTADSFAGFVEEIRKDKHSRVVVLPEYRVPLPSRQLASMAEILGDHPDLAEGRKLWSDRIFIDFNNGHGLRTLTAHWSGRKPVWTRLALWSLRALSHQAMRPLIAVTVGDKDIGRNEKAESAQPFAIGRSPLAAER